MTAKKIGRPTEDPKTYQMRIRLSKEDEKKLSFCSEKLSVNKSEVIRIGIDKIYKECQ